MKVTLTFIPQAWVNDYAVTVDAEGPTTCEVPAEAVKGIKPRTYASDDLRLRPEAPQWWRDWTGPFEIEWELPTEGEPT